MSPGTKLCPDCAEEVKAAARKCRFCGYRFEPPLVSAGLVSDQDLRDAAPSTTPSSTSSFSTNPPTVSQHVAANPQVGDEITVAQQSIDLTPFRDRLNAVAETAKEWKDFRSTRRRRRKIGRDIWFLQKAMSGRWERLAEEAATAKPIVFICTGHAELLVLNLSDVLVDIGSPGATRLPADEAMAKLMKHRSDDRYDVTPRDLEVLRARLPTLRDTVGRNVASVRSALLPLEDTQALPVEVSDKIVEARQATLDLVNLAEVSAAKWLDRADLAAAGAFEDSQASRSQRHLEMSWDGICDVLELNAQSIVVLGQSEMVADVLRRMQLR